MDNKLYQLMNWPVIEEIIFSESNKPHDLLGPHAKGSNVLLQMYYPKAKAVCLQLLPSLEEIPMEMADEDGFFALMIPKKKMTGYRYVITDENQEEITCLDAYRHKLQIKASDEKAFQCGIHYTIYDKLGAHPMILDGEEGVFFAVWAPNALRVSAVGDFNNWDGRRHQMYKHDNSGIFEVFVPEAAIGQNYKFEIKLKSGLTYLKTDPYCFGSELRPGTASVITDISQYDWKDSKWLKERSCRQAKDAPISIYELYLGSFVRAEAGMEYANYREIAVKVVDYVKKMRYTHVELMPVMEHPFDASWGYQVIGYYAPTARYGTPKDFMSFVDYLHGAGIGVILDWVPAHFPRDAHGLSNFDGTCLYEHADPRQASHPHWGTLIYNYGRPQVSNYLISNALFWVEKYHVDGIRMDAVASMLYLDYGKNDGEWVANMYGGNENLEAVEFIKHLNSILKRRDPGVLSIAEESTAWPMVTGALESGGLGFDLKWNMGWMNDYLTYIGYDPYDRGHHLNELTFSMIYNYSEQFMLVLSHDEVVHGKSSLVNKMPGELPQKFANLRLTLAYMMTHPGKKLLFMGQDLGELAEWNEGRCVEWELDEVAKHLGIQTLMKDLNKLYTTEKALFELDLTSEGFEWINCIDTKTCTLRFIRKGKKKDDFMLIVANFSGVSLDIVTGVPKAGKYKEILNTDDVKYGGSGCINGRVKTAKKLSSDDMEYQIGIKIAPLAISILQYKGEQK